MRILFLAVYLIVISSACFAQSPAEQPAFEVASVKRSDPGVTGRTAIGCHGGPGSSDPGLLTCTNAALSMLVAVAYNLQFYELISPEWMNQGGSASGYDVAAKIPPGATKHSRKINFHRLGVMV